MCVCGVIVMRQGQGQQAAGGEEEESAARRLAQASPLAFALPLAPTHACLPPPPLLPCPAAAAERVYHEGRLKYGGAAARRAAPAGPSADELRDTY